MKTGYMNDVGRRVGPALPGCLWGIAILSLVVATVANVACSGPSILTPPTGKGTSYPCGTMSHQCSGGGCCSNAEDCGGDVPGCPAGACCASGMSPAMKRAASGQGRQP